MRWKRLSSLRIRQTLDRAELNLVVDDQHLKLKRENMGNRVTMLLYAPGEGGW